MLVISCKAQNATRVFRVVGFISAMDPIKQASNELEVKIEILDIIRIPEWGVHQDTVISHGP